MLVPRLVDSSRLFRLIKYIVLVGFILLLVPYLNTPEVHDAYFDVLRSFQDDKKLFLQDFMAHDTEAQWPNHGLQLAKLCANRTWFPEEKAVILSCEPMQGGLGAVKNAHLNCIRFGIEMGGEQSLVDARILIFEKELGTKNISPAELVLPRMHPRSESDITNLNGAKTSKGLHLDYMFSTAHLVDSLAANCPQLKVHDSLDDLYDKPSLLQPLSLWNLAQINTGDQWAVINDTQTTILPDPSILRPALLAIMEQKLPAPPAKRHWPLRVHLGNSLFVWPTLEKGEVLRREIGSLLRTRDDIRLLAGSALYNLAHRFDLPQLLRPDAGFTGAGTLANLTGVHLRTEKDAQSVPEYEVQAQYFLHYLKNHFSPSTSTTASPSNPDDPNSTDLPASSAPSSSKNQPPQRSNIVYLATGLRASDADVQQFRASAAEYGATVVLKRDLFDAAELSVLDHLTWDQRALVDYEIMLRVGHVLGVVESKFAWDLALKRTALYGGRGGGGGGGGGGGEYKAFTAQPNWEGELVMWNDSLSTLFGKSDYAVSAYYGTWP